MKVSRKKKRPTSEKMQDMANLSAKKIKAYFVTGLVILLPLALTLAIFVFIFNLLTEPFVGIVKAVLARYNLLDAGFLFFSADQIQKYFSQLIILVLLFFFTVGLGVLARWFFFHYLIRIWEYILARIPIVNSVYKTSQDVIQSLFSGSSNSFKQVVMVPFPTKDTLAIGFVTKDNISFSGKTDQQWIAVFVPTTPNPTSGFLMMFKQENLTYLDMKVEDALKYVISCGVISSSFNVVSKEQAALAVADTKTPKPPKVQK